MKMKILFLSMPVMLLGIFVSSLSGCSTNEESSIARAFENYNGRYAIYVSKKRYTLTVFDRQIKKIAQYNISYGENPDGLAKLYEGDNRTPEGNYVISEILSMDAEPKTGAYEKLRVMNSTFFRAAQGHHQYGKPGVDLGDNAYGPRFYGLNYPNDADKKRYHAMVEGKKISPVKGKIPGMGYGIAIHGNNDPDSIGHRASSGCVRMFNNDVIELEQYIQLGTPVIIAAE